MFLTRKTLFSCLFFTLLCLFSLTPTTKADTVVITSGSVIYNFNPGSGAITLRGDGFSIDGGLGNADALGFSVAGITCVGGCQPNRIIGLTFSADAGSGQIGVPNNTFTLGGVQYTVFFGLQNPTGGNFFLNLSAPTVQLPSVISSGLEITAPFTASGGIVSNSSLFPFTTLTGQGTVVLRLRTEIQPFIGIVYFAERATYTFGTQPPGVTINAIPEPATLILLGTGLAGVAAKVRRRRKQ